MTNLWRLSVQSRKILRLTVYMTCVFIALSLLSARALSAKVKDAALSLGYELAGLSDLSRGGYTVALNGTRLHYARVITDKPLDEVLERLQEHCDDGDGLLEQELRRIEAEHPKQFERDFPQGALRRGIVRERSDEAGVVLCLVKPAEPRADGLVSALKKFVETSDLSHLGQVRYAFAEKLESGETRVVSFWNNGAFNLEAMFPATGDAQGSDSRVLPRPPQARRTLSAGIEGMPYAVRSYASTQPLTELKSFYVRWMKERGWRFGADAEGTTTYFREDGYQVFVSYSQQDGLSYVTLTEAGRDGQPAIQKVEIER